MQRRVESAAQRAELRERGVGARRIQKRADAAPQRLVQRVAHPFQLVADRGCDVDWQTARVEPGQQVAELRHRSAARRHRSVAAGATQREQHLAAALLRDHDRVEATAADMERNAAGFADGMTDAGEELGMSIDQPAGAADASRLFVGEHGED